VSRVVIVGAGQAGANAASALRATGHQGPVTLIGAEAHRPYERPQLSKELLVDPAAELQSIKTAAFWDESGVDLWLGATVGAVDVERREVALLDGRVAPYDRLLIATGLVPRRCLALEGGAIPLHYLRTFEDARSIRAGLVPGKRIAILGGGIIGLEVASAAVGAGVAVTLIELADQLLGRVLPTEVSRILQASHEAAGVEFCFGVSAVGIDVGAVILSDGSRVAADMIVAGIGVEPPSGIVAAFGLRPDEAFRVDARTATAFDNVHAAGDAAIQFDAWHDRWMRVETWANAQNQAIVAAKAMIGQDVRYEGPLWFWSDQLGINLQVVGCALGDGLVFRGDPSSNRFSVVSLRGDEVVGGVTWNNPKEMAALRRLVAARKRVAKGDLENPCFDLRAAAAA